MAGKLRKLLKVGLFLLPVAVLLGLACIYYTVDEPPPEDADLLPHRAAIPREENGFYYVNLAWEDFCWKTPDKNGAAKPEAGALSGENADDGSEEEEAPEDVATKVFSMITRDRAWDHAFAAAVLDANRGILERLDKALSAPRFQLRELRNLGEPYISLGGFRALHGIQGLKARYEFEAGWEARAVSEMLKLIHLFYRVEEGEGCTWETYMADVIAVSALEYLTALVRRTNLGAEELRGLVDELARYYTTEGALKESLKTEYSLLCRTLEDRSVEGLADYFEMPRPSGFSRRFCFKPNATKRLFAEGVRAIRDELAAPPGRRETVDFDALSGGKVGWFPGRNWLGRALFQRAMPHVEQRMLRCRVEKDLRLSFLRVFIALKCHKLSKGSFPRSLGELVPDFLPEVPLDPYDGKPLRYSAEKKIVYSVGEDLEDSEGSSAEDEKHALDDRSEPTLRLEMPSN